MRIPGLKVVDRGLFLSVVTSTIIALYALFRLSGNIINDIDVTYFGTTTTGTVTNIEVLPIGEGGEEIGCIDYSFDAVDRTISYGVRVHPDHIKDKVFFTDGRARTFVTYSKMYPKHHWISGTQSANHSLFDLLMSTVFFLFQLGLLLIVAGFVGVFSLYLIGAVFLHRDDLIEVVFPRKTTA
jgi:hypothetical protein